jgi:hypothetical protein
MRYRSERNLRLGIYTEIGRQNNKNNKNKKKKVDTGQL